MKIIDSITIRYFRSVYTLNIGQCEDITIVSGRNDVGKSNILKSTELIFFVNNPTIFIILILLRTIPIFAEMK